MTRWLFTILAALSLLMCVAVCVLWVRSYRRMDGVRYWSPQVVRFVFSDHGRIYVVFASPVEHDKRGWELETLDVQDRPSVWERDAGDANYAADLLGFGYINADGLEGLADRLRAVTIPHWFVCLTSAASPARRAWKALRRRRHACAGLCASCGYDLRATPGRCPECGAAPAKAAA